MFKKGKEQTEVAKTTAKQTSIKVKMLCMILPVIIVGFAILMVISVSSLRSESISLTVEANLNALDSSSMSMRKNIEEVRMTAIDLANGFGKYFEKLELSDYLLSASGMIQHNDMIHGSGVWFEPYRFDKEKKYCGVYWYDDNGEITEKKEKVDVYKLSETVIKELKELKEMRMLNK